MKVTVYELLGMVKDGKAPKKIKYDGQEYKITKILLEDSIYCFNYINEDMEHIFPINTNHLNDTVEILEEEKKIPEKWTELSIGKMCGKSSLNDITPFIATIMRTQNEIIDYLKSKGE